MAQVSLNAKYKVTKITFGLEKNTTRGLVASWSFNGLSTQLDHYKVVWKRRVISENTSTQYIYTIPGGTVTYPNGNPRPFNYDITGLPGDHTINSAGDIIISNTSNISALDGVLDNSNVSREIKEVVTKSSTVWETASESPTNDTNASFHADQEDTCIKLYIYPIAKTKPNSDVKYWPDHIYVTSESEWTFDFEKLAEKPSVPTVSISDDKLVVRIDDLDTSVMSNIDYQVCVNHEDSNLFASGNHAIKNTYMEITTKTVASGAIYKARCRAWRGGVSSDWTDWSSPVESRPPCPRITALNAYTNKSVRIEFKASTNAESYNIEWISENAAEQAFPDLDLSQRANLTLLFNNTNINKGSVTVNHDDISIKTESESTSSSSSSSGLLGGLFGSTSSSSSDDMNAVTLIYYLSATDSSLEQGGKYYIRIKASKSNSDDESWGSETDEKSSVYFIIGTTPKAPTTWSSVNTAITSEDEYVNLYWSHNSEDQSILSASRLHFTIGGQSPTYTYYIGDEAGGDTKYADDGSIIFSISWDKYDYTKNSTRVCKLDIRNVDGADIKWKVATGGALVDELGIPIPGDWSVERVIKIYSEPVFELKLKKPDDSNLDTSDDIYENNTVYSMTTFPLVVHLNVTDAANQSPIGYSINIVPLVDEPYKTIDGAGNILTVSEKSKIYSKYVTDDGTNFEWYEDIGPGDVTLYNNLTYQITSALTMNSGITVSDTKYFKVNWEEDFYSPGAEISIDTDELTASIRPYISLEPDQDDSDVIFSVYRREYDGTYVEIESNITGNNHYTPDPHPALNYARYRIVARSKSTGSVSFYDTEPLEVGEYGVVIQWDEPWQTYDGSETDRIGSMLKLYYNIRKSFSNDVDVSFVNYMGREHPVSYYGTHKGEKMTWSVEIDKTDKETLYAIRRLSRWAGDVYVREPSGVGYWANIKVSYNEDYDSLVVPISFDITRVEGGI